MSLAEKVIEKINELKESGTEITDEMIDDIIADVKLHHISLLKQELKDSYLSLIHI